MAEVTVNGGRVVYEFVGPADGEVVVLTPGGRFGMSFGGVRDLADRLAAGGKRVLLWDRPNCGLSDIQLFGKTESHMRAATLGAVIEELRIGPVVAAGGSGGARDMIVFAHMYPHLVMKLALWSIVGGTFSTMNLAAVYVLNELRAVQMHGIEGVFELPTWAELVRANTRNRVRLEEAGTDGFRRTMNRWLDAYVPKPNEVIPGVRDWEVERLEVPTLVIRGGTNDRDHPARTSYEIHALIKGSILVDPPWPEDAWEQSLAASMAGTGRIFDPWQHAAPVLLDFFDERPVRQNFVTERIS
ncbi:alpha/beta hydrolase [Rhodococcus fascians]|nr:alpha/beta hydrolase [Rhodococcus fascians]MBY4140947.1 alpha/beta hydrolase [Rhodococcus fascians]MBY4219611.1 alpha/beta hydrolase [Rhodococcus fascians]MBY4221920.1 alpha/beta hydrolase [Rhodococcus fascians]MBY4233921.1 alpha/beta hydrolase [Rhodococcus fascians]